MEIKKILIANRGEIALRVMRTAKDMGIKTVAIYSTADRKALYVQYADEAYCIGEAPSAQSYLLGDKIIALAQSCGADAIHPGYGFLSENANFSRKCKEAGVIFIGPSAESIEIMGSKIGAKKAAASYNIPLVPGINEAISDVKAAKEVAKSIGYPILIKASAGGGGKGMRLVEKEEDFAEQMQRAVSEAIAAFGDGAVFIEKFVTSPRHIEIQLVGDKHGNVIHFFERECSIQRRHQKLVEEAPSACLTPEIREKMGKCATDVARACNYYGAGTVEFVVDDALNFYFLEMNTRLQVEHPVSELITGVDLVKLQILVAEGKPLPLKQEDLTIKGHAIEIRVCAENPLNSFLPEVGTLTTYKRPQGTGIRVDDGFEQGMEIPIYYDSMIAKLITYGQDRNEAIARMSRAIDEYQITGVATTLQFCKFVMQHEAFVSGNFNTKFIEKYYKPEMLAQNLNENESKVAAMLLHHLLGKAQQQNPTEGQQEVATVPKSKWRERNR
jgi:acetyl-CoA carboxylase biotin carboxylase subunit